MDQGSGAGGPTSLGRVRLLAKLRSGTAMFWPALCLLLTTGPMVSLPPKADELWKIYFYGAKCSSDALGTFASLLSQTWSYLTLSGNFRPLGRILEYLNFLAAYWLITLAGLPLNIALGVMRSLSLLLLFVATQALLSRLLKLRTGSRTHSLASVIMLLAFVPLVTNSGGVSALTSFSALYIQSSAFVVLAVFAFAEPSLREPGRVSSLRYASFVALGMLLASVNEIMYLAVPLSLFTFLVLAFTRSNSTRALLATRGSRLLVAVLIGFLVVFIPTRIVISLLCTNPYAASAVNVSGLPLSVLWRRLLSGLPLYSWHKNGALEFVSGEGRGMVASLFGLTLAAFAILRPRGAMRFSAQRCAPTRVPAAQDSPPVAGFQFLRILLIGTAMVLLAGLLSSLSVQMQGGPLRTLLRAWKETPLSYAGWCLILGAGLAWLLTRFRWALWLGAALSLAVALALTMSFGSNLSETRALTADARSTASLRLGVELANFDSTEAGERRRCGLIAETTAAYGPTLRQLSEKIFLAADTFTREAYDVPYCTEAE